MTGAVTEKGTNLELRQITNKLTAYTGCFCCCSFSTWADKVPENWKQKWGLQQYEARD